MSIYSETADDVRRNLKPLGDLADTSLAMALAKRKRKEDLADDQSRRDFQNSIIDKQAKLNEQAAEKAEARRLETAKEALRMQTYEKARSLGIKVAKVDDKQQHLDDLITEKEREINRTLIKGYQEQGRAYNKQIAVAESRYFAHLKDKGSSDQISTAIMNVYNDTTATAGLWPEQKEALRAAATADDPSKAFQEVLNKIRSQHGWFSKDATESGRADKLFEAFDLKRGTIVADDKKMELPVLAEGIQAAYANAREFNKKIGDTLPGLLSKFSAGEQSVIQKQMGVANPFKGMTDSSGKLKAPSAAGGSQVPINPPAPGAGNPLVLPPPSVGAIPPSPMNADDESPPVVSPVIPSGGPFDPPPTNVGPVPGGKFSPTIAPTGNFGSPLNVAPIPPQSSMGSPEQLKQAIMRDAQASHSSNPNPRFIDASEEEVRSAYNLNDTVIAPGNGHHLVEMMNSKDPKQRAFGISAFNSLVKAVRVMGTGSLPPISTLA